MEFELGTLDTSKMDITSINDTQVVLLRFEIHRFWFRLAFTPYHGTRPVLFLGHPPPKRDVGGSSLRFPFKAAPKRRARATSRPRRAREDEAAPGASSGFARCWPSSAEGSRQADGLGGAGQGNGGTCLVGTEAYAK